LENGTEIFDFRAVFTFSTVYNTVHKFVGRTVKKYQDLAVDNNFYSYSMCHIVYEYYSKEIVADTQIAQRFLCRDIAVFLSPIFKGTMRFFENCISYARTPSFVLHFVRTFLKEMCSPKLGVWVQDLRFDDAGNPTPVLRASLCDVP